MSYADLVALAQAADDEYCRLQEDNEQLQDALFRFTVVEDDGLPDKSGQYLCVFDDGTNESHEWYILQAEIDGDCIDDVGGRALIAWAEKPTYTPIK